MTRLATILCLAAIAGCGEGKKLSRGERQYAAYVDQVTRAGETPAESIPDDFYPDFEHGADFNLPDTVELTEPNFYRDDIVVDDEGTRWRVTDPCWMKSRRYPNGGYAAYSRDGWWYRCKPEKAGQQQDDHKYIHESDLTGATAP